MSYASLLPLAALLLVAAPPPARAVAPDAAHPWTAPVGPPLVVRRAFDPPAVRWAAGHRGVDLAAPAGAVVRAAGAGTVTYAGVLAGRGVVVVRHGALRTTYEPVTPLVRPGTAVARGTPVATLAAGHGGTSPPGAALHWGLLRGDTYLDPLLLLPRGPSRLVPVTPPGAPSPPYAAAGPAAASAVAASAVAAPPPAAGPGTPPPPPPPGRRASLPVAVGAPAALGATALALNRRRPPRNRGSPG